MNFPNSKVGLIGKWSIEQRPKITVHTVYGTTHYCIKAKDEKANKP